MLTIVARVLICARGLLRKGAYDEAGVEMDRCIDGALTSENPDVSEVGLAKGEKGRVPWISHCQDKDIRD